MKLFNLFNLDRLAVAPRWTFLMLCLVFLTSKDFLSREIWCFTFGVWISKNILLKYLAAIYLCRDHDPAAQGNPECLLWAVSWRSYFPSTKLHCMRAQEETYMLLFLQFLEPALILCVFIIIYYSFLISSLITANVPRVVLLVFNV